LQHNSATNTVFHVCTIIHYFFSKLRNLHVVFVVTAQDIEIDWSNDPVNLSVLMLPLITLVCLLTYLEREILNSLS